MSTTTRLKSSRTETRDVAPPFVNALIEERERRLAELRRYDRFIAQAAGQISLQGFWRTLKRQDEEAIQRLTNWLDHQDSNPSLV